MRFVVAVLALATSARIAAGDAPSDSASAAASKTAPLPQSAAEHRFALSVNEPLGWIGAGALAVSAYGSIDLHQVIRLNVASWSHERTKQWDLTSGAVFGEGGGLPGTGRYTAASASWMYFSRRPYDGFSTDIGAVVRFRDTSDQDNDVPYASTSVTSKTVAASGMLGWSWLGWDRVFASVQVGALIGGEFGSQVVHADNTMDVSSSVARFAVEGEAMMRFGVILN